MANVFSTKQFGAGHVLGAFILIGGVAGVTAFAIDRHQHEIVAARRELAAAPSVGRNPRGARFR